MQSQSKGSKQSQYAIAVSFCLLYSFCYFLTELIPLPMFWYYPLEHRWVYGATNLPKGLMMGWYGKVLLCLLIATAGSGLLALTLKLTRRELPAQLQGLLDLAMMSSVLFALYYIARSMAYRVL